MQSILYIISIIFWISNYSVSQVVAQSTDDIQNSKTYLIEFINTMRRTNGLQPCQPLPALEAHAQKRTNFQSYVREITDVNFDGIETPSIVELSIAAPLYSKCSGFETGMDSLVTNAQVISCLIQADALKQSSLLQNAQYCGVGVSLSAPFPETFYWTIALSNGNPPNPLLTDITSLTQAEQEKIFDSFWMGAYEKGSKKTERLLKKINEHIVHNPWTNAALTSMQDLAATGSGASYGALQSNEGRSNSRAGIAAYSSQGSQSPLSSSSQGSQVPVAYTSQDSQAPLSSSSQGGQVPVAYTSQDNPPPVSYTSQGTPTPLTYSSQEGNPVSSETSGPGSSPPSASSTPLYSSPSDDTDSAQPLSSDAYTPSPLASPSTSQSSTPSYSSSPLTNDQATSSPISYTDDHEAPSPLASPYGSEHRIPASSPFASNGEYPVASPSASPMTSTFVTNKYSPFSPTSGCSCQCPPGCVLTCSGGSTY